MIQNQSRWGNIRSLLCMLMGMLLSANVFAQQMTVQGHIKDSNGEPIIGANHGLRW